MSTSVLLALIWLLVANLRAMFPSKDNLWGFAYGLIATGAPLLIWIVIEHGVLIAGLFLLMGAWVLRWPVYYAFLWLRQSLKTADIP